MFFRKTAPAFAWALLILLLCALPGNKLPRVRFDFIIPPDKLIHGFLFAVLAFLLTLGYTKQISFDKLQRNAGPTAILTAGLYGYCIELLQKYVFVGRGFEWMDILADTIGGLIGWLVWVNYKNRFAS